MAANLYQSNKDLLQAATEHSQVKHAFEVAKQDVEHMEINAPFNGIIDSIEVSDGQWVNPGQKIATFYKYPADEVEIFVQPSKAAEIKVGQKAEVIYNKKTIKGEVLSISRVADSRTRTMRGTILIENNEDVPINGNVTVKVFPEKKRVMVVPISSLTLGKNQKIGIVIALGDKANFHEVKLLSQDATDAVIESFEDEVTLITYGAGFLSDDSVIKVTL